MVRSLSCDRVIRLAPDRVSPFGHPGLTGCVRLPPAFRSLPRPSSPLYTQASPVRFRSLDYMINVAEREQSSRISVPSFSLGGQAKHALLLAKRIITLESVEQANGLIHCYSKRIRFPRSTYSFTFQTAMSVLAAFRGEPSIVSDLFADFNRCAPHNFIPSTQRTKRKPRFEKGAKDIAISR